LSKTETSCGQNLEFPLLDSRQAGGQTGQEKRGLLIHTHTTVSRICWFDFTWFSCAEFFSPYRNVLHKSANCQAFCFLLKSRDKELFFFAFHARNFYSFGHEFGRSTTPESRRLDCGRRETFRNSNPAHVESSIQAHLHGSAFVLVDDLKIDAERSGTAQGCRARWPRRPNPPKTKSAPATRRTTGQTWRCVCDGGSIGAARRDCQRQGRLQRRPASRVVFGSNRATGRCAQSSRVQADRCRCAAISSGVAKRDGADGILICLRLHLAGVLRHLAH